MLELFLKYAVMGILATIGHPKISRLMKITTVFFQSEYTLRGRIPSQ